MHRKCWNNFTLMIILKPQKKTRNSFLQIIFNTRSFNLIYVEQNFLLLYNNLQPNNNAWLFTPSSLFWTIENNNNNGIVSEALIDFHSSLKFPNYCNNLWLLLFTILTALIQFTFRFLWKINLGENFYY